MDKSKIKVSVEQIVERKHALNAARNTVGKKFLDKQPSDKFWRSILIAKHSPIRVVKYLIRIENIPSWVSVHLIRHHIGVEKFVTTRRTDRTGDVRNRDEMPQGELVDVLLDVNAEAIMNISLKRCCALSSKETRCVWNKVVDALKEVDPVLASLCVAECIQKGYCPEMETCGYVSSEKASIQRDSLISGKLVIKE
jgi:hypothetical protein